MPDWLTPLLDAAILVPFLVLCVRVSGLRTFAKMSSYDFAVTVSLGSVLAGTVLDPATAWWQGALAMAALLVVQWTIGVARSRVAGVRRLTDNVPLLLMRDGRVLHANLAAARVTAEEVEAQLRAAGVAEPGEVAAMVLETTGDVSVIRGGPAGPVLGHVAGTKDDGPPRGRTVG